MKKFFSTMAMALICATALAQTDYVTVSPITISASETKTMTLNLINETDFDGFQFDITLPEGFSFASKTTGRGDNKKVTYICSLSERADEAHMLSTASTIERVLTCVCMYTPNGNETRTTPFYSTNLSDEKSRALMYFDVKADDDVAPGVYAGSVTGIVFNESVVKEKGTTTVSHHLDDVEFTIMVMNDGTVVPFTMTDAGYATLMLPFDAEIPAGLKAYVCSAVDENETVVAEEQESIKANTPLLVAGSTGNYEFTGTPVNTKTEYTTGVLTGVLEETYVTTGHVLQNHQGDVAFYLIEEDAAEGETILPYRCYIRDNSLAKKIRISDDNFNGIDEVRNIDTNDSNLYDISGRKVVKSHKGVYIKDNKKVVLK